jgi:hypothetical protein
MLSGTCIWGMPTENNEGNINMDLRKICLRMAGG